MAEGLYFVDTFSIVAKCKLLTLQICFYENIQRLVTNT